MSLQRLSHNQWLAQFSLHLTNAGYAHGTRKYYVPRAGEFLAYLRRQRITLSSVRATDVDRYLQHALHGFRPRYGRGPADMSSWRTAHAAPVDLFLRFARNASGVNSAKTTFNGCSRFVDFRLRRCRIAARK